MPAYNTVLWLPNALIATGVLGALGFWRWRRGGTPSGLRWAGIALVPLALYFTGLWRLTWSVAFDISRWVTGFVFHPLTWLGIALGVSACGLIWTAAKLGSRQRRRGDLHPHTPGRQVTTGAGRSGEFDDIEAILKQRGIG